MMSNIVKTSCNEGMHYSKFGSRRKRAGNSTKLAQLVIAVPIKTMKMWNKSELLVQLDGEVTNRG